MNAKYQIGDKVTTGTQVFEVGSANWCDDGLFEGFAYRLRNVGRRDKGGLIEHAESTLTKV